MLASLRSLLTAHAPSMTEADEDLIYAAMVSPESEANDYALRTCACGERIDGFDAYLDHLLTAAAGE